MELRATQAQEVKYYRAGSEMRQARDQEGKSKNQTRHIVNGAVVEEENPAPESLLC